MKVVVSSGNLVEPPYEIEAAHTVVVKDNFGNPIYVAIHQAHDSIWAITAEDPRFADTVRELGITKRLTVSLGGNGEKT